jgi:hypothetical protein
MGYNARNDEIRDNVTRECGVSGKRSGTRWRLSADSMRGSRPKAIRGSGPRLPLHSLQSITG